MYLIIVLLMLGMSGNVLGQAPDTLWTRTYGYPGTEEICNDVISMASGFLLCGERNQPGIVEGLAIRVDSAGNELWSKTYETSQTCRLYGACEDGGSGFVLVGFTDGATNSFIQHCNSSGDTIWTARYGSTQNCQFRDVIKRANGNYLAVGFIQGASNAQVLVAEFNSNGGRNWSREYGSSASDVAHSVTESVDGRLYVVCDGLGVLALSPGGDSLWSRTLPAQLRGISVSFDSTILIAGYSTGFWIAFMNSDGDTISTKRFLGYRQSAVCTDLIRTQGGGFALCGYSRIDGADYTKATVLRIDADGDSTWLVDMFSQGDQYGFGISQSVQGNFVIGGYKSIPYPNQQADFWAGSLDQELRQVLRPIGSEQLAIFSTDTFRWTGVGFEGGVSIKLNRHYPIGAWETITDSTENDGAYEWFVTDPLSDSCRIRICALQDTFCDVSDGNFSIVSSQGYLALGAKQRNLTRL